MLLVGRYTPVRASPIYFSCFLTLVITCLVLSFSTATPLAYSTEGYQNTDHQNSSSLENSTSNDLYIIRAVVYEIGLLTDTDNTTDESTERHEEVHIQFYDPPHESDGLLKLEDVVADKANDTDSTEN